MTDYWWCTRCDCYHVGSSLCQVSETGGIYHGFPATSELARIATALERIAKAIEKLCALDGDS